jgi:uncharacterized membrane protein
MFMKRLWFCDNQIKKDKIDTCSPLSTTPIPVGEKTVNADNPTQMVPHCQLCGRKAPDAELLPAGFVRPVIAKLILDAKADWSTHGYICVDDLNKFRYDYIRSLLETEKGELTEMDKEVLESLEKHEILSSHVDQEYESDLTFGERLSDRIATFGGSWKFLILFGCVLFFWLLINSVFLFFKPFDPFPYILLNLILSCLAAVQAPVIMMSQNRQEAKDRLRASHDYQINLKAELEIRNLHQKIDHILSRQWERLVEIQEIQLELLEEIRTKGLPT